MNLDFEVVEMKTASDLGKRVRKRAFSRARMTILVGLSSSTSEIPRINKLKTATEPVELALPLMILLRQFMRPFRLISYLCGTNKDDD
jgi:hypothetical protein